MLESEATGGDAIPFELLKAGGDEAVKVLTTMCNNVYGRRRNGRLIYMKGDKKECRNYRTIALNSHASKQGTLEGTAEKTRCLIPELPIEQVGFRRAR